MQAHLTGSHVYDNPRPESDLGLALLLEPWQFDLFVRLSDTHRDGDEEGEPSSVGSERTTRDSISVRYGKLNILLTTNNAMYEAWENAKTQLKIEADRLSKINAHVTRDRAVEVFKAYEREVK